MSTHRRIVVEGRGGPEVLRIRSEDSPTPGRGQVRIRSEVIGVAFGDIMRRRGILAPPGAFTPGYDLVGEVDAVGPGVEATWVGRRVAVFLPRIGFGAYAEQVLAPAELLIPVADDLASDTMAALGLNYITARQILRRFGPTRTGASMLVHGAAGGVGTAMLDLGRLQQLQMFGTASKGKHEVLTERGATPIDYRSEDFVQRIASLTEEGVDLVTDPIGGAHLERSHATLRPGGTLVSFGLTGQLDEGWSALLKDASRLACLWIRPGKRVRLYGIGATTSMAECRDDWTWLMERCNEGAFSPLIGARVPFDEVAEAHDLVDRAAVVGKVLLTV